MWFWRLTKASRPTFDGEGARLFGGRWSHPGVALVYTAESLALAVLEFFVHLSAQDPPDLAAIRAEIPEELKILRVDPSALPADWRHMPAPAPLAELGTKWVRGAATAVLAVPSAIVPRETNYLLNPAHPEFGRIKIDRPEPFSLDPRMLGRRPVSRGPARPRRAPR